MRQYVSSEATELVTTKFVIRLRAEIWRSNLILCQYPSNKSPSLGLHEIQIEFYHNPEDHDYNLEKIMYTKCCYSYIETSKAPEKTITVTAAADIRILGNQLRKSKVCQKCHGKQFSGHD